MTLFAYRRYDLNSSGVALKGYRAEWSGRSFSAECRGSELDAVAHITDRIIGGYHACFCGIHGSWTPTGRSIHDGQILGITAHWGTVEICADGLRSSQARLVEILIPVSAISWMGDAGMNRFLFGLALRYQVALADGVGVKLSLIHGTGANLRSLKPSDALLSQYQSVHVKMTVCDCDECQT